jgi:DUF1680 family protein
MTAKTSFPDIPDVALELSLAQPEPAKIRVRTPSWAVNEMTVMVNGERAGSGKPGSYVLLDRTWRAGDTIHFTLPMGFRLTRYAGLDQIEGHERYALEYGPILMAIEGSDDVRLHAGGSNADDLLKQLTPAYGRPLHFDISGNADFHYAPYFAVKNDPFTTYPVIDRS